MIRSHPARETRPPTGCDTGLSTPKTETKAAGAETPAAFLSDLSSRLPHSPPNLPLKGDPAKQEERPALASKQFEGDFAAWLHLDVQSETFHKDHAEQDQEFRQARLLTPLQKEFDDGG